MNIYLTSFKKYQPFPYLILLVAAILAYLPVSFMLFSLKNDIIVIEYPIKYFISECIHNGIMPFWFNTWALGFPLETVLTWNIFSPLQFIPAFIFHYNIYLLHLEFIFYIYFAGCCMYYFLKKHILSDKRLALLLAVCYMLSGFNIASSQWLLYITASGFIPLIISSLLDLFKNPGWKSTLKFSIVFYCFLTGVYVAFTIITIYILLTITVFYLYRILYIEKAGIQKIIIYIGLTCLLTTILCSTCIYYTIQLLPYIKRGIAITTDPLFFNSNYLHPQGLASLLFPLSTVKMHPTNTESTMLNVYMGLAPLLFFPYCIFKSFRQKNQVALFLFAASIFFLIISFGPLTPVRNWLNFFPGFAFFRNAGLIRLFFIFFTLLFIGKTLNKDRLKLLLDDNSEFRKIYFITATFLLSVCIIITCIYFPAYSRFFERKAELRTIPQLISKDVTFIINGLIQIFILVILIYSMHTRKKYLFALIITSDVILNTLICTPFFTVSSYNLSETNNILKSKEGFPVQENNLSNVPTTYQSNKATWYNINVYKKLVSSNDSYWGPLFFKSFDPSQSSFDEHFNHKILFTYNNSANLNITKQLPGYVSASIQCKDTATIYFLQNYYPGWCAYLNEKPLEIKAAERGGMSVLLPGSGRLQLKYERPVLYFVIIITQILIISLTIFYVIKRFLQIILIKKQS